MRLHLRLQLQRLDFAFSFSSSPSFLSLFHQQSSPINCTTIVYNQLYCRSGRTSPLLSLAEKGDVRAMALQVSVLPKDLFVLLRPSAHYSTTLCATARSLPSDTSACCCLIWSSQRLLCAVRPLLVCAALSEDLFVLLRLPSRNSTTLCSTARYSPLDTTTCRRHF